MSARRPFASWRALIWTLLLTCVVAAACGSDGDPELDSASDTSDDVTAEPGDTGDEPADDTVGGELRIGAIPDQEPERLQRTYGLLSDYLESRLAGISVEYVPVTDYQGAVSAFRAGDLDIVWFGGLTGVQARLEVDGARAVAQRDIDAEFTSVFIAGANVGLDPIGDVAGLGALADHSFTFGSESSTSGRLMPQAFLTEAGLDVTADLDGAPGFSGSHDATIEVVSAGTYEVGALNSQVWDSRLEEGTVDTDRVVEIFRTPPYYDYHWVARPDVDDRLGDGTVAAFVDALVALDPAVDADAAILELFGAAAFIPTDDANYAAIEAVGRDAGLIR